MGLGQAFPPINLAVALPNRQETRKCCRENRSQKAKKVFQEEAAGKSRRDRGKTQPIS
jgi:hypothetical protein